MTKALKNPLIILQTKKEKPWGYPEVGDMKTSMAIGRHQPHRQSKRSR
jgi:hypothetical protein